MYVYPNLYMYVHMLYTCNVQGLCSYTKSPGSDYQGLIMNNNIGILTLTINNYMYLYLVLHT